jgi:hypothetical protein
MTFDVGKFEAARFEPRTRTVPVEALAAFFADGEAPEWRVRGLNATELHRALEASKRSGTIDAVIKALAATGDQAEAVRRAIGLSSREVPGEVAKRLEMLVAGSIAPTIELPHAVKLAEAFPIEFLVLTNAITELTGMGFDVVKPAAASQPTTDSSSACDLPSSEAATSTNAGPTSSRKDGKRTKN